MSEYSFMAEEEGVSEPPDERGLLLNREIVPALSKIGDTEYLDDED